MLKIERAKSFVKDMKNLKLADIQFQKFICYLSLILKEELLPIEAKDHTLLGEWKDTREFHLGEDLAVIYRIIEEEKILQLIRIGSHSKLFKKF